MKKVLLAFLLTTGILSCLCGDANPFWNVTDFDFEFINDQNEWSTSDTITQDSMTFIVDFDFEYLSSINMNDLFITAAAATSCPDPGTDGMKDPITNIILTCNEDYNGITAGESLATIVKHNNIEGFQGFTDQVATYPAVDFFNFTVIEKPSSLDSFKFNLLLEFESGTNLSRETGYIFWQ